MQPFDGNAVLARKGPIVQHLIGVRLEPPIHGQIVGHLGVYNAVGPGRLRSAPMVAGLDELMDGADFLLKSDVDQRNTGIFLCTVFSNLLLLYENNLGTVSRAFKPPL